MERNTFAALVSVLWKQKIKNPGTRVHNVVHKTKDRVEHRSAAVNDGSVTLPLSSMLFPAVVLSPGTLVVDAAKTHLLAKAQ